MLNGLLDAYDDINCLPKAREVIDRSSLPEPLAMNFGSDESLLSNSNTKRSRIMARNLKRSEAAEVHAIVGYIHERELAYLFREQD